MSAFFSHIRKDKILSLGFSMSCLFLVATFGIILYHFPKLPPFVPLYNQLPWGNARLGTQAELFIPLLVAGTIFLTNFVLSGVFYGKMPLLARMLSITNLLIALLTLLFSVRTIWLIAQ